MKATVESDTDRKQALIRFMTGKSPLVRSWAGSFVEQLFEKEESVPLLGKALSSILAVNESRSNYKGEKRTDHLQANR
jgi:hypothetical protein